MLNCDIKMNIDLKSNIKSNIKKQNETSMSDNKIKDNVTNDTEKKNRKQTYSLSVTNHIS